MQNNSDMEKVSFENVIVYQTFDDQGLSENTVIYSTDDDRYIDIEANDLEVHALDDLAAVQISEDNASTYAEMMSEIAGKAELEEFDIRVSGSENLNYNNASLHINGEKYNVDPATALLYGSTIESADIEVEVEALQEDLSAYEDLDEIMAIPDPENWTSLDISDIEVTEEGVEPEETFNYKDIVAHQTQRDPMKVLKFGGEEHGLVVNVGNYAGRVPEAELRNRSRQKVQNGEYNNQALLSPSLDTAFQNNEVNPSLVKALDIGTVPLKIAEESGIETDFIIADENDEQGKDYFLEIGGQAVRTSPYVMASAIPWKEDTLGVGDEIIRKLDKAERRGGGGSQITAQEHTTPKERDGEAYIQ